MKKAIYLFILVSFMVSCTSKETGYTIKGKIAGADSVTFILQKREGGKYVKIDSATVVKGEFTIKGGKVDYPLYVTLMAKNMRKGMSFFLENSNITISGHIDSLYQAKVTGSKTQDEYESVMKMEEPVNEKMSELSKAYSEISEKGNKASLDSIMAIYKDLNEKARQIEKDFIRNNPSSYAAPVILQGISYEMDASEIESLVNVLDTNVAKTEIVVTLKERAEKMKSVEIGRTAPDFTMNDVDGNPVTLSEIYGKSKLLLVDFWASWCGPCRRENPNVVKAWKDFNKKGFNILGVSLDRPGDKEKWMQAIKDDNLTWNHVSDLQYWNCAAAKLYAVNSIPANFLLDEKGTIIAKNLRGEDLYNKLKELLSAR
jgi:peroxiredoxin